MSDLRHGDTVEILTGKYAGRLGFVVRVSFGYYGPGKMLAVAEAVVVRLRSGEAGRWRHLSYAPEKLKLHRRAPEREE